MRGSAGAGVWGDAALILGVDGSVRGVVGPDRRVAAADGEPDVNQVASEVEQPDLVWGGDDDFAELVIVVVHGCCR